MRVDNVWDLLLNRVNNCFTELPKSYHNAVETGQAAESKRRNSMNL